MVSVLNPADITERQDELGVGDGEAPPGTYALVFGVSDAVETSVGSLGTVRFPPGGYAYVGSAFGSNGLGRVDRHRRVATGDHGVRHWHVDSLGGHPDVRLDAVVAAPNVDAECALAEALDPDTSPVRGFGSSDCDCRAHLAHRASVETLRCSVVEFFEGKELGESPQ
ncbi:GIY-YIG nuclease family protein [Halogeometricum limi]|uniref:Uri superfamily endonuclease n=1 Tax=Halogeometricum limi TaxID=555875 RepID=A0A1I6IRH0_9EURY|nr:GIY-YIG nuclease family protein [Halogeometricum limi]SFR69346.1 Uri superfamily endonuclease [Halogeometricum limi]